MFKLIQSILLIILIAAVFILGNRILNETGVNAVDPAKLAEQKDKLVEGIDQVKKEAEKGLPAFGSFLISLRLPCR
mgnify:CR=1 FL=1